MVEDRAQLTDQRYPQAPERPPPEGKVRVEGGCRRGVEHGRAVTDADHDVLPVTLDVDVDLPGSAPIAVDDHVGHPLVDGLDQAADRGWVDTEGPGSGADAGSNAGQLTEAGFDVEIRGRHVRGVAPENRRAHAKKNTACGNRFGTFGSVA